MAHLYPILVLNAAVLTDVAQFPAGRQFFPDPRGAEQILLPL
jgi:hypothetical protein